VSLSFFGFSFPCLWKHGSVHRLSIFVFPTRFASCPIFHSRSRDMWHVARGNTRAVLRAQWQTVIICIVRYVLMMDNNRRSDGHDRQRGPGRCRRGGRGRPCCGRSNEGLETVPIPPLETSHPKGQGVCRSKDVTDIGDVPLDSPLWNIGLHHAQQSSAHIHRHHSRSVVYDTESLLQPAPVVPSAGS